MKIDEHANRTEKEFGIRGENIHRWIDGFFEMDNFEFFLHGDSSSINNPYNHRKFRHCSEALVEAYREFEGKYKKEEIKNIFESHLKDDYNGYIPTLEDFENETFTEKFHSSNIKTEIDTILTNEELSDYFKGENYKKNRNDPIVSSGFLSRILLPTIIAVILFITSVFTIIIPEFHDNLLNKKKEMIKELTNSAISVVNHSIKLEKENLLTKEMAQKRAIQAIENMRYGNENKDYFWITDMFPKMIIHPYRKDLIGKDLTNYKDKNDKSGKKLFVEFVKIVKLSEEGYFKYLWQWKDDSSKIFPKLSFVKKIPHWNWVIGTGIYINDVEEEIQALTNHLIMTFGILSLFLVFILFFIVYQSHNIESSRLKAESGLIEAKNRYRALVEASSEGYLLELNGKNIYTNSFLKKLTGFNEEELMRVNIWDTLLPNIKLNQRIKNHIEKVYNGEGETSQFEAIICGKNGKQMDVIISTSRIFFTKSMGHVITIRRIISRKDPWIPGIPESVAFNSDPLFVTKEAGEICHTLEENKKEPEISIIDNASILDCLIKMEKNNKNSLLVKDNENTPIGIINWRDIALLGGGHPAEILLEINSADSMGQIVRMTNHLPSIIRNMTIHGAKHFVIRGMVNRV